MAVYDYTVSGNVQGKRQGLESIYLAMVRSLSWCRDVPRISNHFAQSVQPGRARRRRLRKAHLTIHQWLQGGKSELG
jgi:hypothetical protein